MRASGYLILVIVSEWSLLFSYPEKILQGTLKNSQE